MDKVAPAAIDANHFRFALEFPALNLLPGNYLVRAHALDPEGVRMFDHVERPVTVTGDARELGLVRLAHHWRD
jgi:lipopolysaccharide transport system ATP-binding protein